LAERGREGKGLSDGRRVASQRAAASFRPPALVDLNGQAGKNAAILRTFVLTVSIE
jgi:hypothetical protein